MRSIQQRKFLDEAAPWLHGSGLRNQMSAEREMKGVQLADAILKDVEKLGKLLENDFSPFSHR